MPHSVRVRPIIVALTLLVAPGALAASGTFDFMKHLPKESYFYMGGDAGQLRKDFLASPIGRLFTHPRVVEALGKLPGYLRSQIERELDLDDFEREFGVSFFEFIGWFRGRACMTWPSIDWRQGPSMVIAVELGPKRAEILAFSEKLARESGGGDGAEPTRERYKGHEIVRWPVRWGPPIAHAVVGDCVVYAANGWRVEDVIDRYRGGGESLEDNARLRAAMRRTRVGDREPVFSTWWDMKGFREIMQAGLSGEGRAGEEFRQVMAFTGFSAVDSLAYRLGARGGDWEGKFLVDSTGGHEGAVALIAELAAAPADLGILERVPGRAGIVRCGSLHTGKLLRELVTLSRDTVPELAAEVDSFTEGFEEATGLSLRRDLYPLGRIDYAWFTVRPATGALLPDGLLVARTSQIDPYLSVARKLAVRGRGTPRPVECLGHTVTVLRIGGFAEMLGFGGPPRARREPGGPAAGRNALTADPAFALCWADTPDGWTVVSATPQAVGRYLEVYRGEEAFTASEERMEVIQGRIGPGSSFAYLAGGDLLLSAYNTLVATLVRLAPVISGRLAQVADDVAVDPALLPAGEAFAGSFRPGFLRVHARKTSLLIHGERALTNSLGGAGLPFVALLGGFLVPVRASARRAEALAMEHAMRVADLEHGHATELTEAPEEAAAGPEASAEAKRLRRIGEAMREHMRKTRSRAYPWCPEGKISGFAEMAKSGALPDPGLLVHPLSSDRAAARGDDGRLTITEAHSSYYLVPWRQGASDHPSRFLCYEKKPFLRGGRLVLHVDLSVSFHEEAEFQRLLKEQIAKYARRSPVRRD